MSVRASKDHILGTIARYYSGKLQEFGATPKGVDWNGPESQRVRFSQLVRVLDGAQGTFGLIDYGCGYGALVDYLDEVGLSCRYQGFDVSPEMVGAARMRHGSRHWCSFTSGEEPLVRADYAIASGIFNVRLHHDVDIWRQHVLDVLDAIDSLSIRGFSFNMLTSYADPERQRPDLYYADPLLYFDHCKRRFSPRVALLHDYPLYEFTMLVRK